MSACKLHIAIIEPSHIVYEGIVNILLNSGNHFHVYRIDSLDEIETQNFQEPIEIVLLNPSFTMHNSKDFTHIQQKFPHIIWIALCYAYYDKEILSCFNETIEIADNQDTIIEKIQKFSSEECANKKNGEKELLSEREIQVLAQLVKGLSNKEIADTLNISTHTVISHRKNITQKTGIKSQSGLTIYAISNRIITIEGI